MLEGVLDWNQKRSKVSYKSKFSSFTQKRKIGKKSFTEPETSDPEMASWANLMSTELVGEPVLPSYRDPIATEEEELFGAEYLLHQAIGAPDIDLETGEPTLTQTPIAGIEFGGEDATDEGIFSGDDQDDFQDLERCPFILSPSQLSTVSLISTPDPLLALVPQTQSTLTLPSTSSTDILSSSLPDTLSLTSTPDTLLTAVQQTSSTLAPASCFSASTLSSSVPYQSTPSPDDTTALRMTLSPFSATQTSMFSENRDSPVFELDSSLLDSDSILADTPSSGLRRVPLATEATQPPSPMNLTESTQSLHFSPVCTTPLAAPATQPTVTDPYHPDLLDQDSDSPASMQSPLLFASSATLRRVPLAPPATQPPCPVTSHTLRPPSMSPEFHVPSTPVPQRSTQPTSSPGAAQTLPAPSTSGPPSTTSRRERLVTFAAAMVAVKDHKALSDDDVKEIKNHWEAMDDASKAPADFRRRETEPRKPAKQRPGHKVLKGSPDKNASDIDSNAYVEEIIIQLQQHHGVDVRQKTHKDNVLADYQKICRLSSAQLKNKLKGLQMYTINKNKYEGWLKRKSEEEARHIGQISLAIGNISRASTTALPNPRSLPSSPVQRHGPLMTAYMPSPTYIRPPPDHRPRPEPSSVPSLSADVPTLPPYPLQQPSTPSIHPPNFQANQPSTHTFLPISTVPCLPSGQPCQQPPGTSYQQQPSRYRELQPAYHRPVPITLQSTNPPNTLSLSLSTDSRSCQPQAPPQTPQATPTISAEEERLHRNRTYTAEYRKRKCEDEQQQQQPQQQPPKRKIQHKEHKPRLCPHCKKIQKGDTGHTWTKVNGKTKIVCNNIPAQVPVTVPPTPAPVMANPPFQSTLLSQSLLPHTATPWDQYGSYQGAHSTLPPQTMLPHTATSWDNYYQGAIIPQTTTSTTLYENRRYPHQVPLSSTTAPFIPDPPATVYSNLLSPTLHPYTATQWDQYVSNQTSNVPRGVIRPQTTTSFTLLDQGAPPPPTPSPVIPHHHAPFPSTLPSQTMLPHTATEWIAVTRPPTTTSST